MPVFGCAVSLGLQSGYRNRNAGLARVVAARNGYSGSDLLAGDRLLQRRRPGTAHVVRLFFQRGRIHVARAIRTDLFLLLGAAPVGSFAGGKLAGCYVMHSAGLSCQSEGAKEDSVVRV